MNATFHLLVLLILLGIAAPAEGQNRRNDRDRWEHPRDCDCRVCRGGGDYYRDYRYRRNPSINSLYGGFNISYLTRGGNERFYPDNLTKYYIGFRRENVLLPLFYYGGGLELYVNGGRDNLREELNLLYLAVPLSLRLEVGPLYARGGFTGALRLSAQEYDNGDQINIPRGKYRVFDYGVSLGAGVRFLVFFAEVRHTWGQMNVVDDFTTRQWQLGGGIMF